MKLRTSDQPLLGSAILATLGVVLISLVVTNRISNYLQPSFKPWIVLTGVLLVVLSIWTTQSTRDSASHEHASALPRLSIGSHHHSLNSTALLLIVPLTLAVVCMPSSLGSSLLNSTAVGGGSFESPSSVGQKSAGQNGQQGGGQAEPQRIARNADGTLAYPPLEDGTVNEISLEELNNRFSFGNKADLEGKTVKTVGFAAAIPGSETGWRLGRYKIYCCAADAVPFAATMITDQKMPPADSWLEIEGTAVTNSDDGLPALKVTSITPIDQPSNPYL